MKKFQDVLVIGLALFAMFFGAGNLIFPPYIGLISGDKWYMSLLGFLLTGIGLPLIGIIVMSKNEGKFENFAGKVGTNFSKGLGIIIMLAIGPLLAIPRTGATTYEMAIKPIFPTVNPIIVTSIYFAINLYLVINPSSVVDKIGKILTPVLLTMLAIIIFKGISTPIGSPIVTDIQNPFSKAFAEGYQTMDALASTVFAGIVIGSVVAKGYKDTKDQIRLTLMSGVIAALGLLLVYGGLMYLGATASGLYGADISKTQLTIAITERLLGTFGKVALGVAVGFACLTTSVGLTATAGDFFSNLTNNRISYKAVVIIVTVFSAVVSNFGVEKIVKLAVPLLVTVYPVVIVLIVLNIFDEFIKNKNCYAGAVYLTLIISIVDGLAAIGLNLKGVQNFVAKLPFASAGFAWILPAIIGLIIPLIFSRKQEA
ncbi:branched-chain amino acid transport system II carrier protein [Thermobrachium celere]|uniref:Branched-chain amino acid transport system carrier protein n=1 Tax=Thermobrachium celere DSM 8682 TaxID=941824 RepID=R7RQR8_9CLOT|nr:branched-chain amino acid transport system II carrier protein [Thermobrachium celere]CDF57638.1 Branched-chain amino acid transport system carrier protein [Thermobrachium celere DSM 8682]